MKTALSFFKDIFGLLWWYILFVFTCGYSAIFKPSRFNSITSDRYVYPDKDFQDKRNCQYIANCTRKISFGYCPEKCSLYEK